MNGYTKENTWWNVKLPGQRNPAFKDVQRAVTSGSLLMESAVSSALKSITKSARYEVAVMDMKVRPADKFVSRFQRTCARRRGFPSRPCSLRAMTGRPA